MARITVAAAGNAETNINLINARFQAEALRRLRGHDCGVLDNSFYSSANTTGLNRAANNNFMWQLTATNVQSISVGRGMATAYGYDIQSESTINFTATPPSGGAKYLFIYLEWNLSNPVEALGSLLLHDNGASASWTPPYQDNLITNPIGKYQMPLYRIAVNSAGTVTATTNWTALGVLTVGYPLRAKNADRTELADKATYAGNNTSATIDARLNSLSARLDALGFRTGSITLPNGSATVNKVDRQGNYVILNLEISYPNSGETNGMSRSSGSNKSATWNFTVPVNFRPKNDMNISAVAYGYFYDGAGSGGTYSFIPTCTLNTSGVLSITTSGYSGSSDWPPSVLKRFKLNLGYEAPAITT